MPGLKNTPLDVEVGLDSLNHDQFMYAGTYDYLEASRTVMPYAGLVLRNVLGDDVIDACVNGGFYDDPDVLDPTFLDPMAKAMQDAWSRHSKSSQYKVSSRFIFGGVQFGGYGMCINQEVRDGHPRHGYIGLSLPLVDEAEYFFEIPTRDCFNPRDAIAINTQYINPREELPRGEPTLVAGPGDIVAWTDLQPMRHGCRAPKTHLAALFDTRIIKLPVSEASAEAL